MPQLDSTWFASQIFWLFITFVVLYFLVSRIMLPALLSVMDQRKATIDGDISASDHAAREAEQAKKHYEEALAEAREASRKLINDAMEEHKAKSEKEVAAVQEKIAAKLAEAEKNITQKRENLLSELKSSNQQMAELIASKLTGKA